MAESNVQRSRGYLIFIVILMGLVALMDQYLSLIESTAIPEILTEYSMSYDEFLFWQGIYGIISFVVFLINWNMDVIGRKKGILVLILILGVTALLIPLIAIEFHVFMLLYAIIIMATLSNAWSIPVAEESPPDKRGTLGSVAFFIGLIPIYAFLGNTIISNFGWRWLYGFMGIFMIAVLVLWIFMKEPQRWANLHKEGISDVSKLKKALKSLSKKDALYIVISSIVYGCWTISYKLGVSGGGVFFQDLLGKTADEWDTIFLIGGLMTIIGALVSGIIMDKIGRNKVLIIGCIGAVISYILLGLVRIQIFFWLIFFFMALLLSWIIVYFTEIFPTDNRGTSVGFVNTFARIGYVIGPLIGSALVAAFPTMELYWIVAGLIMLIPLATLLRKPLETKQKELEEIQKER